MRRNDQKSLVVTKGCTMNNWIPCKSCGKKNNVSYKTKGLVQRCRYCGELVQGKGPAQSAMVVWLIVLAVLVVVAMANRQ